MVAGTELSAALAALHQASDRPSFQQLETFLQCVRQSRTRMPDEVYLRGMDLLRRYKRKLSPDEEWSLREEVAIAALQTGRLNLARNLVQSIQRQFSSSIRATRLYAMYLEASGDLEGAKATYKAQLDKNPQEATIVRRTAAAKTGEGDLVGALQILREHLSVHLTDWISWEEAATLYLRLGSLQQAAYCLEEVLLHQPSNVSVQLLLADTLYSLGGPTNWRAARGYYSGVIEATEASNLRALYGVCACAAQLMGSKGTGSSSGKRSGGQDGSRTSSNVDEKGNAETSGETLAKLAAEHMIELHAKVSPEKLSLVKSMLKSQGLLNW